MATYDKLNVKTSAMNRWTRLMNVYRAVSSFNGPRIRTDIQNETVESETDKGKSIYLCHVCLKSAREAVINTCGHLYCWPCLYQWLETHDRVCLGCNANISVDNLIPIYGHNSYSDRTEQSEIPPRPTAKYIEVKYPWLMAIINFSLAFYIELYMGLFPYGTISPIILDFRAAQILYQYTNESVLATLILLLTLIFFAWFLI